MLWYNQKLKSADYLCHYESAVPTRKEKYIDKKHTRLGCKLAWTYTNGVISLCEDQTNGLRFERTIEDGYWFVGEIYERYLRSRPLFLAFYACTQTNPRNTINSATRAEGRTLFRHC